MTLETSSTDAQTATPPVLEYGRQSTLRRRIRRGMFACLALAALVGGLWYAVPSVMHAIRLKSAIAECNAWAKTARTIILPAQTLVYSEVASDRKPDAAGVPTMSFYGSTPNRMGSNNFISFLDQYPNLRYVWHDMSGVPLLGDNYAVIYVHEHPSMLAPAGTPWPIFTVSYVGVPFNSVHPELYGFINTQFYVEARLFPLDAKGQSTIAKGFAVPRRQSRPIANLRLFAGQPDPSDPTQFFIPFSCDAGSGRFEFQVDANASASGGAAEPSVTISWDTSPTTLPFTK